MTIVIENIQTWQANIPAEWALQKAIDFEARNALAIKALQSPRTEKRLGIDVVVEGMTAEEVQKELQNAEDIWNAMLTIDKVHTCGRVNKDNEPVIHIGQIGDIWMDALSISDALKAFTIPKQISVNYSALWIIIRTYKANQYKEMYLDKNNKELIDEYNKLVKEAVKGKEEQEADANALAIAIAQAKKERGIQ